MRTKNIKPMVLSGLCFIILLLALVVSHTSKAKAQSENDTVTLQTQVVSGNNVLYIVRGNKIFVYGYDLNNLKSGGKSAGKKSSATDLALDALFTGNFPQAKLVLLQTLEIGK